MIAKKEMLNKLVVAKEILIKSIGEKGIFAGSGPRYRNQYWTRDAALVLIPALRSLLNLEDLLGYKSTYHFGLVNIDEVARKHFYNLTRRQSYNGAIPILFSDFAKLIENKMKKCKWDGKSLDLSDSFVLRRVFDGMYGDFKRFPEFLDFPDDNERGLYRLTPGTTDSELLFCYALLKEHGDCEAVRRALLYLETHYMHNGLHCGADWRDTMEVFFRDKPLLSNNALLYKVYKMRGDYKKAEALKNKIDSVFWTGDTYLDYPGGDRFDPLGMSLALLHGLVPSSRYEAVLAGFRSIDTPCGVTIKCRHNAYQPGEAEVIEKTDGVVVWPFVVGFTILATVEIDENFAFEQFEKLHKLNGFAEYYDPFDGSRWGEYEQGWSAAMYVRAVEKLIDSF